MGRLRKKKKRNKKRGKQGVLPRFTGVALLKMLAYELSRRVRDGPISSVYRIPNDEAKYMISFKILRRDPEEVKRHAHRIGAYRVFGQIEF